jgi:hypothetical protein
MIEPTEEPSCPATRSVASYQGSIRGVYSHAVPAARPFQGAAYALRQGYKGGSPVSGVGPFPRQTARETLWPMDWVGPLRRCSRDFG